METLLTRSRNLSLRPSHTDDEILIRMTYVLCKEFGWSYEEVKSCPIPFALGLLMEIDKDQKEMKKQTDKIKK